MYPLKECNKCSFRHYWKEYGGCDSIEGCKKIYNTPQEIRK